jgi:hypothetical protein
VGVIIGLLIAALGVASQLLRDNDSPPPFRDNDSPPPFSSYEDDGIFVRYPNSWVADNSDLNPNDDIIPISFRPPEGNGIVWVYIEDGHSESVSRYLDRRIEDIEDIDHEDIEEDTDIEFAGNNGYRIVSTYDYRGTATKQTEIGTIHDDKLYSIHYIAPSESYNSYLGAVDEIINSFRIVQ